MQGEAPASHTTADRVAHVGHAPAPALGPPRTTSSNVLALTETKTRLLCVPGGQTMISSHRSAKRAVRTRCPGLARLAVPPTPSSVVPPRGACAGVAALITVICPLKSAGAVIPEMNNPDDRHLRDHLSCLLSLSLSFRKHRPGFGGRAGFEQGRAN